MALPRRLAAEAVATMLRLAAVVGSGIMGERLTGGSVALALLADSLATGAALVTLILTFRPISGAHLNPAVTPADAWQGGLPWQDVPGHLAAQVTGAPTPAYWFTASTAFANPAVTLARVAGDTFAGIDPGDVPGFVAAQLAGAATASAFFRWLAGPADSPDDAHDTGAAAR